MYLLNIQITIERQENFYRNLGEVKLEVQNVISCGVDFYVAMILTRIFGKR